MEARIVKIIKQLANIYVKRIHPSYYDDLVQEGYVAAVRAIESYSTDNKANIYSWVAIKARYAMLEMIRSERKHDVLHDYCFDRNKGPYDIEYDTIKKDIYYHIHNTINALPGRYQAIIYHHYIIGVELQAIANMLGLTAARVSQLHRPALELLRARLPRNIA